MVKKIIKNICEWIKSNKHVYDGMHFKLYIVHYDGTYIIEMVEHDISLCIQVVDTEFSSRKLASTYLENNLNSIIEYLLDTYVYATQDK